MFPFIIIVVVLIRCCIIHRGKRHQGNTSGVTSMESTTKQPDSIKKTTTAVDEESQGGTSEPVNDPHQADKESEIDDERLFRDVPINNSRQADEESMGEITYGSYPGTIWSLAAASVADGQTLFSRDSYRTKADEISESTHTKDGELSVVEFEINAPAGMLGLVLESPVGGVPIVQEIKGHSPLAGQVQVGDLLVAVDGKDVTSWNAPAVTRLIASKKHNPGRDLIFARQRN